MALYLLIELKLIQLCPTWHRYLRIFSLEQKNMEICDIKSYGEEFSGRLVINCGEIEGKYLHWIRPIETDIA